MDVLIIAGKILLITIGTILSVILILFLTTSVTLHVKYDNGLSLKVKYLFFTIFMSPDSPGRTNRRKRKEKKKKAKEEKQFLKQQRKTDKLRRKRKRAAHLKTAGDRRAKKGKSTQPPQQRSSEYGGQTRDQAYGSKSEIPDPARKASKADTEGDTKSKADLKLIMRMLDKAKPHIKRLFKKIRITGLLVDIMVGGDDAAKTAISYGIHCTAVNGFIGFLGKTVTLKTDRVAIKADFDLEKTDYFARATVKLRLSTLIRCAVWCALAVKGEMEGNDIQKQKQDQNKPPKKAA